MSTFVVTPGMPRTREYLPPMTMDALGFPQPDYTAQESPASAPQVVDTATRMPLAPDAVGRLTNYGGQCTQEDIQSGRCPQPVRRVAAPMRRPVAVARPVQTPVAEPAPMTPMNPVAAAVGLPPETRPMRGQDFAVSTDYANCAPGMPCNGKDPGVEQSADMARAYLNGDAVPLHIAQHLDKLVSGYVQGDMGRRGTQNQQELQRLAADGSVQDAAEKFTAQGVPPAIAMRLAMGPRMTRDAYGAAAQDQQDAQFEGVNAANNFGILAGKPAGYGVNFAPRYVKSGDGTVNYMLGNSNVTRQLPEGVSPLMYMGAAQNSMADEEYTPDALTTMIQGVEAGQSKAAQASMKASLIAAQTNAANARATKSLRVPVARARAGVKPVDPAKAMKLQIDIAAGLNKQGRTAEAKAVLDAIPIPGLAKNRPMSN